MKKRITERILKVFWAAACATVLARSYAADPTPKAGDLDLSFNPGKVMPREVNATASGSVQAIACQPDDRILIAGLFDQAYPERHLPIKGAVSLLVQQPDGKILVGGS